MDGNDINEEKEQVDRLFEVDPFELANGLLDDALTATTRPKDFDPYQFLEDKPLGRGAIGDVWLAREEAADRKVAIKLLRRIAEPDVWARREIKRLGALEHQFIARLYNHGVMEDGTPWLAMEYVEGEALDEHCEKQKSSVRQRLKLFYEICEAVQYAHRSGIIHGDLKPSNIRVTQKGVPKLLDFGLAEQFQSPDGAVPESPAALGFTPAYAAPEQFRGETVGVYIDVYALGVILYELLTGSLPFEASRYTYAEVMEIKGSDRRPEPPSAVVRRSGSLGGGSVTASEWRDLDAICLKALEGSIRLRYSSVETLIQDLDRFERDEPVRARLPYRWTYPFGKYLRRNRVAVLSTSLVFVAISGLTFFYTLRLTGERNRAQEAAARSQRVEEFMEDLFQGGDDEAGPTEDMRVITLLEKAEKDAKALTADLKVQADFYQTLGTVFESLGQLDRAESLLQGALKDRKSVFGPDHEEVADVLLRLALLRQDEGQLAESEKLLREALAMDQRHLRWNDPKVAEATILLGRILEQRGAYQQAIQTLNQALGMLPANVERFRKWRSACLTLLANAYFYLGDYSRADSLNQQALQMDKLLYGEHHPSLADDLINLGQIQTQWGRFADAEKYFRQAFDINRSWYGKDNPQTADVATYVAQVLRSEGRESEAEAILKQSLVVFDKTYKSPNPRVALVIDEMGKIAQNRGNLNEAEADFIKASEIYRSAFGDVDRHTAIPLANLGSVYAAEKQYGRAEGLLRDVIHRLTQVVPAASLDVGTTRIRLGDVLVKEKRYGEAERELLAGYGILTKQKSAQPQWSMLAREDLAITYGALNQPGKAAAFRAELAASK